MMGKTHIMMGIASALAVTTPRTVGSCLAAVIGGAAGGMMSDIDIKSGPGSKDTSSTRSIVLKIISVCLLVDLVTDGGILIYMQYCNDRILLMGMAYFVLLYWIGTLREHREFTHSLLALFLFSSSIAMFCMPVAIPFAIGFLSHILLDILNKKSVKIFFPAEKGVCLRLCYANQLGNRICFVVGVIGTVLCLGQAGWHIVSYYFLH